MFFKDLVMIILVHTVKKSKIVLKKKKRCLGGNVMKLI